MKRWKISLKTGLVTTIIICWLVPIVIVVAVAGVLLGDSYRQQQQQEIDSTARSAMEQVQRQLTDAIDSSKAVSYDGVIRSAYREYLLDGLGIQLYRTTKDYLNQSFLRDTKYQAVFISFWDESITQPYVLGGDTTGYQITQALQNHTDEILSVMASADTQIRFLLLEDGLYMARNLLDSSFTPYATVVMVLDGRQVFQSLNVLGTEGNVHVSLDACRFQVDSQGNLIPLAQQIALENTLEFSAQIDGHALTVTAETVGYDLWQDNPWLRWEIISVAMLVLPLLVVSVVVFSLHVNRPIQTLAEANQRVQAGQRGYKIEKQAPNKEFQKLYSNFNAMSEELQNQFERSFLEQQATQKAQIKALQSQINPHFLNNTLEIINWEARLADNERVSAMIEALSTMLSGALDRDGRSQIPLKQELVYVDAYLYIIRERLGDGFYVHKQIDEAILDQPIPRLSLQPIVENAVEHDITKRRGGNLWIRVFSRDEKILLEVEHDGTMTDTDRENIRQLLSEEEEEGSRVGLRNVSQRLRLIYGDRASLQVWQTENATILARIQFPKLGEWL